tara:strand:+ start:68 stop:733 length:666 start_codon:yes stop_codon:yes gene_type:complete
MAFKMKGSSFYGKSNQSPTSKVLQMKSPMPMAKDDNLSDAEKQKIAKKRLDDAWKARQARYKAEDIARLKKLAEKKEADKFIDKPMNYDQIGTTTTSALPMDDNKVSKAKKDVQGAKDMIGAYVEPGKATKAGGSIYEDKYEGTGETRASKRAGRKIAKAEKKITRAGELYAKGKTKRADRKVKSADKKTTKARKIISKRGSGTTTRSVQEKYKNDPRYQD